MTVIVGQTYHGTIAAAPADKTPERSAPAVRIDSAAKPYLQQVAKRVPYTSDDADQDRAELGDQHAQPDPRLRHAAEQRGPADVHDGRIDYWGIQMTNWKDAPALNDPNEVTKIGRRTYRLYYNGSHLHMVVLDYGARRTGS